jgi:small subunit ribosomal protein S6
MSEGKNTYEGMFLVPPSQSDFEHAGKPIRAVLDRSEAEILSIKPWDERRLAYDIRGNRRGLYVLTYFKVAPGRISEIEHDCQLSEDILRVLILRRDHLTDEQIQSQTPATARAERMRSAESEKAPEGKKPEADDAAKAAPPPDAEKAEATAAAALAEEPAATADAGDAGSDGAVEKPDAPEETPAAEGAPAEQTPAKPQAAAEPAAADNEAAPAEDDSQNPT